ncbi:MAG: hypothetical protein OXI87_14890 [Albidovulum sp.]|nr:hypothetical protein [Albidovulum sp.]MDE0306143.1 hypothetical protein [Albidovulum sp.]MDE0531851.1 hypothetical protein [Albidovulum sp.]
MAAIVEIARGLSRIPILLASTSPFVLMVTTFSDVVLRSALNSLIEAATELTRILLAFIVF